MTNNLPKSILGRIEQEANACKVEVKALDYAKQKMYCEGHYDGFTAAAILHNPGAWNLEAKYDGDLKEQLVVRGLDNELEIWSRERYNDYVSGCVEFGAGSAYGIVTHFNGKDDLLKTRLDPLPPDNGLVDKEGVKALFDAYVMYMSKGGTLELNDWLDSSPLETLKQKQSI